MRQLDTAVRFSANISFKDKEPLLAVARDRINGAIADPNLSAEQKLKIFHAVMAVGLGKTCAPPDEGQGRASNCDV
ncbi:MAG: hypothetical protein ACR652_01035 [Methylocystis sp.]|uniref:hypothetical protein n=1 Tax=Methylocystis sp. TaxID=1911079 RepID=UPI003DA68FD6